MSEDTPIPGPLNNVIRIDDERIKGHLDRVVRGTVEETLNSLLKRDPFVPLRLTLTTGETVDITDPVPVFIENLAVHIFGVRRAGAARRRVRQPHAQRGGRR